ncbi:MAG TPA: PEGA domain-containing protein [Polyangiaceae bacterium]
MPALAQSAPPDAPASAPTAPSTTQQAVAQTLFDQARKAMADGKFQEACVKFADSNRLAPGTGTLLNLATCHVKIGKLATAWVEMNNAADSDRRLGNVQRLAWIRQQIDDLSPKLAHLTVGVAPATPAGFSVVLDGATLDPAAYGSPTPVDPGEHVVTASAPGYETWSTKIAVDQNGVEKSVVVPVLGQKSDVVAPAPAPSKEEPAPAPAPEIDQKKRTVAYVLGGVAVVGIGVGTVFGIKTFSDWSTRNDNCPGGRCNQTAVDASSSAKTAAVISDISFGVAIVAAAAGTYLFVTSKHTPAPVSVGAAPLPGGGAASLSATF